MRVRKTADIGRIASKHFVKLTTVSGTKNNSSHNSHNTIYNNNQQQIGDKEPSGTLTGSKRNKGGIVFSTGGGAKDKTGAPKTPPLNNMNHVTVQNPQNDNEVEEMETQEGEFT